MSPKPSDFSDASLSPSDSSRLEDIRLQVLRNQKTEAQPKTWVGKALRGGEWVLGGLSDLVNRHVTLPAAQELTEDPIAKYRLEVLSQQPTPIYGGEVARAAGILNPDENASLPEKIGAGIGRFALDVAGDPLSFVPFNELTEAGRVTKILHSAIEEGRTIERGSSIWNRVEKVYGKGFLETTNEDIAQARKTLEAEHANLTDLPEPVRKQLSKEAFNAQQAARDNLQPYYYKGDVGGMMSNKEAAEAQRAAQSREEITSGPLEGLTKLPNVSTKPVVRKVFLGSPQHEADILEHGYDPALRFPEKVQFQPLEGHNIPGFKEDIPAHLPDDVKAQLHESLVRKKALQKALGAGNIDAQLKSLGDDVVKATEEVAPFKAQQREYRAWIGNERAKGTNLDSHVMKQYLSEWRGRFEPAIAESETKIASARREANELLKVRASLREAAGGEDLRTAAANATKVYEVNKTRALRTHPLTLDYIDNRRKDLFGQVRQLLRAHGREDLVQFIGDPSKMGHTKLARAIQITDEGVAEIPGLKEVLGQLRDLGQVRKKVINLAQRSRAALRVLQPLRNQQIMQGENSILGLSAEQRKRADELAEALRIGESQGSKKPEELPLIVKAEADKVFKSRMRSKISELYTGNAPLGKQLAAGHRTLAQFELGPIEFAIPGFGKGKFSQGIANLFTAINRNKIVSRIESAFKKAFSTSTSSPEFDKLLTSMRNQALHNAGVELGDAAQIHRELEAAAKDLKIPIEYVNQIVGKVTEESTSGAPLRGLRKLIGPVADKLEKHGRAAQQRFVDIMSPLWADSERKALGLSLTPAERAAGITTAEKIAHDGLEAAKDEIFTEPTFSEDLMNQLIKEPLNVGTRDVSNGFANLNFPAERIQELDRDTTARLLEVLQGRIKPLENQKKALEELPQTLARNKSKDALDFEINRLTEMFDEAVSHGKKQDIFSPPSNRANLVDVLRASTKGTIPELSEAGKRQIVVDSIRTDVRTSARLISGVFKKSGKIPEGVPLTKQAMEEAKKISLRTNEAYVPPVTSKIISEVRAHKKAIEDILRQNGIKSLPLAADPEYLFRSLTKEAQDDIESYLLRKGVLKPGYTKNQFAMAATELMRKEFTLVDHEGVLKLAASHLITDRQAASIIKSKNGLDILNDLYQEKKITKEAYDATVVTLGPSTINEWAQQGRFKWQKESVEPVVHSGDIERSNISDRKRPSYPNKYESGLGRLLRKGKEPSLERIPEGANILDSGGDITRNLTSKNARGDEESLALGSNKTHQPILNLDPAYSAAMRGIRGQQAVTAKQFYNELKTREIGIPVEKAVGEGFKGWRTAPQEELKGYLFPPDVAKALSTWNKFNYNDPAVSDFLKVYDTVQDAWKAWTLAIFPAYHSRNFVGNMWNNWLAGVYNPAHYLLAGRLQTFLLTKGKHEAFNFTDGLGKVWSAKELVGEMKRLGVLDKGFMGAEVYNDLAHKLSSGGLISKIGRNNPVVKFAFEHIGQPIENNARMAHFIAKLAEGHTTEDAALSVKKYLFDYSELTDFEKNVMKRIFPFYSWTRKNVPLQLQHLITDPAKFSVLYKAHAEVEDDTQKPNEKFLPQWVIENYPTRIRYNKNTKQYEYFLANAWLPSMDLVKLLELHETAVNMLAPVPKEIIEQMFNYDFFLKKKIEEVGGEKTKFMGVNLPTRVVHGAKIVRLLNEIDKWNKPDQDFSSKLLETLTGKTYSYDEKKSRRSYEFQKKEEVRTIRSRINSEEKQRPQNVKELNRLRAKVRELMRS